MPTSEKNLHSLYSTDASPHQDCRPFGPIQIRVYNADVVDKVVRVMRRRINRLVKINQELNEKHVKPGTTGRRVYYSWKHTKVSGSGHWSSSVGENHSHAMQNWLRSLVK